VGFDWFIGDTGSFAKETCNFKEPSNRSHPINLRKRVCGL